MGDVRGLRADTEPAQTDPRRLSVTDIEVMDPEVSPTELHDWAQS